MSGDEDSVAFREHVATRGRVTIDRAWSNSRNGWWYIATADMPKSGRQRLRTFIPAPGPDAAVHGVGIVVEELAKAVEHFLAEHEA